MENVNFIIVFFEGILSIFSPCILPILPIYLSMLSNSSVENMQHEGFKSRVLITNTILFTLGISTTFFILGSSISAFTSFFNANKNIITIIGGAIILVMGLFYLGVIKSNLLNREKRLDYTYKNMSPIAAFVLGFTFSFGWTPCIGPILASVLLMASTSGNLVTSNLLILTYIIGFILPFIITSLFYSKLFKKFDKMKKYMNEIKKISGILIIVAGLIMVVNGGYNIYKEYKINSDKSSQITENVDKNSNKDSINNNSPNNTLENSDKKQSAIDFTLYDQHGKKHTLSEYKGKTVFLNFFATWCPPCLREIPHINEIYNEYKENKEDVVILSVIVPDVGREGSKESIERFIKEEGIDFPVLFDEGGEVLFDYGVNAFPTTFIINKEGYISEYIPGAMDKNTMKSLIEKDK